MPYGQYSVAESRMADIELGVDDAHDHVRTVGDDAARLNGPVQTVAYSCYHCGIIVAATRPLALEPAAERGGLDDDLPAIHRRDFRVDVTWWRISGVARADAVWVWR
jgi:hypothetical protein